MFLQIALKYLILKVIEITVMVKMVPRWCITVNLMCIFFGRDHTLTLKDEDEYHCMSAFFSLRLILLFCPESGLCLQVLFCLGFSFVTCTAHNFQHVYSFTFDDCQIHSKCDELPFVSHWHMFKMNEIPCRCLEPRQCGWCRNWATGWSVWVLIARRSRTSCGACLAFYSVGTGGPFARSKAVDH
jgi:hypothetical protein